MRLKLTRQLCVMAMKNDAKFEKELTCQFKIPMRNLIHFDLNNLLFNELILTKVYNVSASKVQKSYVS